MVAERPDRIGGTTRALPEGRRRQPRCAALDHATEVGTADDILP
jgi:hypothetical protein